MYCWKQAEDHGGRNANSHDAVHDGYITNTTTQTVLTPAEGIDKDVDCEETMNRVDNEFAAEKPLCQKS